MNTGWTPESDHMKNAAAVVQQLREILGWQCALEIARDAVARHQTPRGLVELLSLALIRAEQESNQ